MHSSLQVLLWAVAMLQQPINGALSREKRFLIFPRANPTRMQFIAGVGIPVDIQLESITVGYVFKAYYLLPWNSSHLVPQVLDRNEEALFRRRRSQSNYEQHQGQLMDVRSEPLDKTPPSGSRWLFYDVLEQLLEQKGWNGRSCVLRSICESAEATFTHASGGVLGELLHILFTPSTTGEPVSELHHETYRYAETVASTISPRQQHGGSVCADTFRECQVSLLDMFSGIFGTPKK